MTTLQTAQVLDPGKKSFAVAAFPTQRIAHDTTNSLFDSMTYTSVEFAARYGVIPKLDVGLKLFPVGGQMDGKFCFLDAPRFVVAADMALGYVTIESDTGANKIKVYLIDLIPSVPGTLKMGEYVSLTASPKFLFSIVKGTTTSTNYLYGGTVGLKVGKRFALLPEAGYITGRLGTDACRRPELCCVD
jgi:hypothetical protein